MTCHACRYVHAFINEAEVAFFGRPAPTLASFTIDSEAKQAMMEEVLLITTYLPLLLSDVAVVIATKMRLSVWCEIWVRSHSWDVCVRERVE